MSTFNMRIDMGPEEAVDALNGYFEKVATWFVGDMEPDIKLPMQVWVDTHEKIIKQRNLENTDWIVRAPISGSWGMPVGMVFDSTIPLDGVPGFIPALGTTYLRADYPYFWSCIQAGGNIVEDTIWQTEKRYGSYSYGDGETTFRVPLLVDFVRGWNPSSSVAMGQWVQDTIQNITGYVRTNRGIVVQEAGGAFARLNMSGEYGTLDHTGSLGFDFDASRVARTGEETAPKHVLLPKYIYTGEVW